MNTILQQKYDHLFALFDTDDNGVIEAQDFIAHAGRLADVIGESRESQRFKSIYAGHMAWWRIIANADTNNDGRVTRKEFIMLLSGLAAEIRSGSEQAERKLIDSVATSFEAIDMDNDGVIVLAEYTLYLKSLNADKGAAEAFARMDVDGSGTLTLDEVRAAILDFFTSADASLPGHTLYGIMD